MRIEVNPRLVAAEGNLFHLQATKKHEAAESSKPCICCLRAYITPLELAIGDHHDKKCNLELPSVRDEDIPILSDPFIRGFVLDILPDDPDERCQR